MKKVSWIVVIAGAVVGLAAVVLTHLGNPANMGFCIACFLRDIAGALKLHSAGIVQYVRPEIVGIIAGAAGAAAGAAGHAIALCSPDEIKKARDVHKLLGRLLPVHPSSASVPAELRAVPEARRKSSSSMQEKRSAPRRKPRKGYGRNGSRAEA